MNFRKKRKGSLIPIAAMGDIAFLLLVFYMATTMVTDQKPRDIPLPRVAAGAKSSPYPLIIYADKKAAARKAVFFFNELVPLKFLPGKLKERNANAPLPPLAYLNIERDLPYRFMQEILDALKEADFRKVIITTRAPETSAGRGGSSP